MYSNSVTAIAQPETLTMVEGKGVCLKMLPMSLL